MADRPGDVQALVDDADAIARTIVSETGKTLAEAFARELGVSADACTWLASGLRCRVSDGV